MKGTVVAPLLWIAFVYAIAHGYLTSIIGTISTGVNFNGLSNPATSGIGGGQAGGLLNPIGTGGGDLAIPSLINPSFGLSGTNNGNGTFTPTDTRIPTFTCATGSPEYGCIIPESVISDLIRLGIIKGNTPGATYGG